MQSTITSVDSIFTGASNVLNRQTQEEIKESISVLTSAIKAIKNSSIIIEQTLTTKNTQINNTIDNFEKISSNLSNVSDELNSFGLSTLLSNLEVSVEGIGSIVNKLESDNSTIGKLINEDEVYNNLNSSIESLNILINDIKANPKKYVHFSVFGRK